MTVDSRLLHIYSHHVSFCVVIWLWDLVLLLAARRGDCHTLAGTRPLIDYRFSMPKTAQNQRLLPGRLRRTKNPSAHAHSHDVISARNNVEVYIQKILQSGFLTFFQPEHWDKDNIEEWFPKKQYKTNNWTDIFENMYTYHYGILHSDVRRTCCSMHWKWRIGVLIIRE